MGWVHVNPQGYCGKGRREGQKGRRERAQEEVSLVDNRNDDNNKKQSEKMKR